MQTGGWSIQRSTLTKVLASLSLAKTDLQVAAESRAIWRQKRWYKNCLVYYGNGVLVLSMPKLAPGAQGSNTEFRLQAITDTRGQRVGHTGAHIEPTTTQARGQRRAQANRQTDRQ